MMTGHHLSFVVSLLLVLKWGNILLGLIVAIVGIVYGMMIGVPIFKKTALGQLLTALYHGLCPQFVECHDQSIEVQPH